MMNAGRKIFCVNGMILTAMLLVQGCGRLGQGRDAIREPHASKEDAVFQRDALAVDLGGGVSMDLVRVEAGSFLMGSNDGRDNERPVREVRITREFWMGKCEVTQREYQQLTGNNPSHFKGDNLPVETVSWHDAVSFCALLTERERLAGRLPEGYVYRLPTEAEWEYAARGGRQGRETTYAGSDDVDEVAWYRINRRDRANPVGTKAANELGLHDMSGNVWEWVHDWYRASYRGLGTVDPVGPARGTNRVYRGGSFWESADYCRVALRVRGCPSFKFADIGFRVVLGPSL